MRNDAKEALEKLEKELLRQETDTLDYTQVFIAPKEPAKKEKWTVGSYLLLAVSLLLLAGMFAVISLLLKLRGGAL